jgi:phospholipid transport system transporter-binding protein
MTSAAPAASVVLPEQLTLQGAAQTLLRLKPLLAQQSGSDVVLDAGSLRVFDTSAVAVLLELRNAALAQGKSLLVRDMPERLKALVTLYGVGELLLPA